ncbi:hypothetical protein VNO77_20859 [Canavalia gladiata]|uniref:Uncharacterized protein n=1 Tax=Canavalia gladiata TaxID=3824 RepID=A0AAN9LTJ3_CANGL
MHQGSGAKEFFPLARVISTFGTEAARANTGSQLLVSHLGNRISLGSKLLQIYAYTKRPAELGCRFSSCQDHDQSLALVIDNSVRVMSKFSYFIKDPLSCDLQENLGTILIDELEMNYHWLICIAILAYHTEPESIKVGWKAETLQPS